MEKLPLIPKTEIFKKMDFTELLKLRKTNKQLKSDINQYITEIYNMKYCRKSIVNMVKELRREEPTVEIIYYNMDNQPIDKPPVGSGILYFPEFRITFPSGFLGQPLTVDVVHMVDESMGNFAIYVGRISDSLTFDVTRGGNKLRIDDVEGNLPTAVLDATMIKRKLGKLFNIIPLHDRIVLTPPLIS